MKITIETPRQEEEDEIIIRCAVLDQDLLILIICTVNYTFFSKTEMIPKATLSYILFSAFLTALITTIFSLIEPVKKSSRTICLILHIACLEATLTGCGIWFDWIDFVLLDMIQMCVSVAGVYLFVFVIYYIQDKHHAERMNRCLERRYQQTQSLTDQLDNQRW